MNRTLPQLSAPTQRTSRDALVHREVRWRLFSRDELPARLRRLERLERAAVEPPPRLARKPDRAA